MVVTSIFIQLIIFLVLVIGVIITFYKYLSAVKGLKQKHLKSCILLSLVLMTYVITINSFSTCIHNFAALKDFKGQYSIPQQSTICEFTEYVSNEGSGKYWIYAKDSINYYFAGDLASVGGQHPEGSSYVYISKKESLTCKRFIEDDVSTWCTVHGGEE